MQIVQPLGKSKWKVNGLFQAHTKRVEITSTELTLDMWVSKDQTLWDVMHDPGKVKEIQLEMLNDDGTLAERIDFTVNCIDTKCNLDYASKDCADVQMQFFISQSRRVTPDDEGIGTQWWRNGGLCE